MSAAAVKRSVRKRAPIGCGYGELSRTVVAMGDFDGDAGRMSVALTLLDSDASLTAESGLCGGIGADAIARPAEAVVGIDPVTLGAGPAGGRVTGADDAVAPCT